MERRDLTAVPPTGGGQVAVQLSVREEPAGGGPAGGGWTVTSLRPRGPRCFVREAEPAPLNPPLASVTSDPPAAQTCTRRAAGGKRVRVSVEAGDTLRVAALGSLMAGLQGWRCRR